MRNVLRQLGPTQQQIEDRECSFTKAKRGKGRYSHKPKHAARYFG